MTMLGVACLLLLRARQMSLVSYLFSSLKCFEGSSGNIYFM